MINTGQVLNDTYEIIECLGSGAGGIIFRAYHRRMRKYVAIKLIKEEIKGTLDNRSEVDILKNLKHEYLPQVIDFVEDNGEVYTVMEFIEGQNFKKIITDRKRFGEKSIGEKSVRKYALQLCEAVEYLHSHRPPIIHSDIKPANIMLTPQDNICLIDFNISIMTSGGAAASMGGSRGFAAPEQFRQIINAPIDADEFHEETRFVDNDETEILLDSEQTNSRAASETRTKNRARAFIDMRTDIYGIGASIYYILTSRVPESGRLDFRGIHCSPLIREIIAKSMNPDPSKRYRNIAELKKALHSKISVRMMMLTAAIICTVLRVGISSFGLLDRIEGNKAAEITAGTSVSGETTDLTEMTLPPRLAFENSPAVKITTVTTASAAPDEEVITIKGEKYSKDLTELSLLTVGLTNEDFKEINKLTNLTYFNLYKSRVSDISPLKNLTNLTKLYLASNQISDISALENLTDLTVLDLHDNQISDISVLENLTNLTYLNLGSNQISDISSLQNLTNLTELKLHGNQIIEKDIEDLKKALPNCHIYY